MNIVDSSLWVEYFLENDIGQSVIDAVKDTGNLCVPGFTHKTNISRIWIVSIISPYSRNDGFAPNPSFAISPLI
jgi:hypothetical protein